MSSKNRRAITSFARKQKQYQIFSDDDETESSSKFGGVLATLKTDKNLQHLPKEKKIQGKQDANRKVIQSPIPYKASIKVDSTTGRHGRTPPPRSVIVGESTQAISPITVQKIKKLGKSNPLCRAQIKSVDDRINNLTCCNDHNEANNDSLLEESGCDSNSGSDDQWSRSGKDSSERSSEFIDDEQQKSENSNSLSDSEDMTQVYYEEDTNNDDFIDGEEDEEEDDDDDEEDVDEYSESEEEFESRLDDEDFIPDEDEDESDSIDDFIVEDTPPKRQRHQRKAALKSASKIKQQLTKATAKVGKIKKAPKADVKKGNMTFNENENRNDTLLPKLCNDFDFEEAKTMSSIAASENECDEELDVDEDEIEDKSAYTHGKLDPSTYETPGANSNDITVLEETPMMAVLPRKTLDFSSPEVQMAMILDDNEAFSDNDDDDLVVTIIDSSEFPLTDDGNDQSDIEKEEVTVSREFNHDLTTKAETKTSPNGELNKSSNIDKYSKTFSNDELISLFNPSCEELDSLNAVIGTEDKKNGILDTSLSSIALAKSEGENPFVKLKSPLKSSSEKPVSLCDEQNKGSNEIETQSMLKATRSNHHFSIDQSEIIDKEENEAQSVLKVMRLNNHPLVNKTIKPAINNNYRQEGLVKRGKWALGAKIGVGSFGQVHVGMNTQNGTLMAVKIFKLKGAIMEDIRTEVELMRSLQHKNIVRYLGAQMDKKFLHIFQEWVPGGSISGLLNKFGSFSIEVIRSYISQTLCGLTFLHDNNIMHRDIKGSNILVNDEGVVKLADFGASKKLKNLSGNMMMSLTARGTPYFMAPEVFAEKYGFKADIWGIGCVAFQMATARPPWKDKGFTNPISLFNYIKKQKGGPKMKHPQIESFSEKQQMSWNLFTEFVKRCFEQEPSKRPSTYELADDPFVLTLCESDGDEESTMYRGLFSPEQQINGPVSTKKLSLSPSRSLFSTTQIVPGTVIQSPSSLKEDDLEQSASISGYDTPPKQQKIHKSPSPDTRDWPQWAVKAADAVNNNTDVTRNDKSELMGSLACSEGSEQKCTQAQLKQQKFYNQNKGNGNCSELRHNISELMGSLALSEDSEEREQRLSAVGTSTLFSKLAGLEFLDSSSKVTNL